MNTTYKSARALVVAIHLLSSVALTTTSVQAMTSGVKLPAPAVSKALDAILLPIDATVAKEFKLGTGQKGVLVLAVQPGGVADKQGIEPGDVLTEILGRPVRKPIDVDIAVRRGLKGGTTGYAFDVYRAGAALTVATVITLALYDETFSVSEISSWESWSESTSFSYSEFVSEYSETIETSYESEETTVEESISEEETSATTEAADDDADDDGTPDATDSDDDNDGTPDDADTDDDNDGIDDGAEDDGAGDDGTADDAGDDAAEDDAAEDDGGADDGGDDSGGDEGGDDSGGDDGGGDDGE